MKRSSSSIKKSIESRRGSESSILGLYLREISKIKPLTREEESELAYQAKAGSREAREALVRGNLRFVITIARRYQSSSLSLMDLIHEGNLGLIQAVDRFDPKRGFHLISYAVWNIRQAISNAVQKNAHALYLPKQRADQLRNIIKIGQSLKAEGKEGANVSLLADILKMEPKKVKHLLSLSPASLSLEDVNQKTNVKLIEGLADQNSVAPDELLAHAEMKYQLNESLRKLSPQEQDVLRMRYGIGRSSFSLSKIAKVIGLSRERTRQIEIKALMKLRNSKEGKKLAAFLSN